MLLLGVLRQVLGLERTYQMTPIFSLLLSGLTKGCLAWHFPWAVLMLFAEDEADEDESVHAFQIEDAQVDVSILVYFVWKRFSQCYRRLRSAAPNSIILCWRNMISATITSTPTSTLISNP